MERTAHYSYQQTGADTSWNYPQPKCENIPSGLVTHNTLSGMEGSIYTAIFSHETHSCSVVCAFHLHNNYM